MHLLQIETDIDVGTQNKEWFVMWVGAWRRVLFDD
jgi:hypothetical protein